jgi:hypothetical protein
MTQKYFRVVDDLSIPNRWYLQGPFTKSGKEVDPRNFTEGKKVRAKRFLTIPLRRPGKPLGLTLADFDMPVASKDVGHLLENLAPQNIQRIPVEISSQPLGYEIINVTTTIKCVDEKESDIMWWIEADERPDKIGQYRMITKLKIVPDLVQESQMFRVQGWEIALVISETVKVALEKRGVAGIRFEEV